ncbi:unnamed protein product [Meganyctiphanes norvegica]|uniref:Uncharacterized protein n=1 Tax=Meganyctiphanes norvegica TaxID=48144 RepID=A0AAV2Q9M0_MEGNR
MKLVILLLLPIAALQTKIGNASPQLQVLTNGIGTNNEIIATFPEGKLISKRETQRISYNGDNHDKDYNVTSNINGHVHIRKILKPILSKKPQRKLKRRLVSKSRISKMPSRRKVYMKRRRVYRKHKINNTYIDKSEINSTSNSKHNSTINNHAIPQTYMVYTHNHTLGDIHKSISAPQGVNKNHIPPKSSMPIVNTPPGDSFEKSSNSNILLSVHSPKKKTFSKTSKLTTIVRKDEVYNSRTEDNNRAYTTSSTTASTTAGHGGYGKLRMATVLAVVTAMLLMPFLALWLAAVMSAARGQIYTPDDRELLL